MTHTDPRAGPPSPPIAARPQPCARCGYDISGLPPSGACPECGLPLRYSTASRPLDSIAPRELHAIARAGEWINVGALCVLAGWVVGWLIAIGLGAAFRTSIHGFVRLIAEYLCVAIGPIGLVMAVYVPIWHMQAYRIPVTVSACVWAAFAIASVTTATASSATMATISDICEVGATTALIACWWLGLRAMRRLVESAGTWKLAKLRYAADAGTLLVLCVQGLVCGAILLGVAAQSLGAGRGFAASVLAATPQCTTFVLLPAYLVSWMLLMNFTLRLRATLNALRNRPRMSDVARPSLGSEDGST